MTFFVQLFVYIVAALITSALTKQPKGSSPSPSEDYQAPTAEEGRPVPVVFGTVWINAPNVVWYGDVKTEPIKG